MKQEFLTKDYYEKNNLSHFLFDITPEGDLTCMMPTGDAVVIAKAISPSQDKLLQLLVETKYLCDELIKEQRKLTTALDIIKQTTELLGKVPEED